MTNDEKKFVKKVNIDKAINKTKIPFILITISIATYIIPFLNGDYDFGVVFEIISLICFIISRYFMGKYDERRSKRYLICSILSIGWILIYDFLILMSSIQNIVETLYNGYYYICGELITIAYLVCLIKINFNLSKADNPEKYRESTDWFYEHYENSNDK